ncbi:MAG: hypothetical protein JWP89_2686 [Schlesneria sp.]|nr:hypothetical protein [Schlesneria sp.]
MERPGFCGLLSFGGVLCVLAGIVGIILVLLGGSQFEANRANSITLLIAGFTILAQSLVSFGVLQSLNWIVLTLLEMKGRSPSVSDSPEMPTETFAEYDAPDGIRNKPVLKRRKS